MRCKYESVQHTKLNPKQRVHLDGLVTCRNRSRIWNKRGCDEENGLCIIRIFIKDASNTIFLPMVKLHLTSFSAMIGTLPSLSSMVSRLFFICLYDKSCDWCSYRMLMESTMQETHALMSTPSICRHNCWHPVQRTSKSSTSLETQLEV